MQLFARNPLSLPVLLACCGIAAAGCTAGHTWAFVVTMAVSLGGLAVAGCGESHRRDRPLADAGPTDAGPGDAEPDARETDAGLDAGDGTWEPCCVDGYIDTCFCEAGWSCNYGWFTDCGGGTCVFPGGEMCEGGDAGPPDAGPPDAGGYWESCCVDGMVDFCFCPAGLACNYGWYTDCGDGTCVADPTGACAVDAGAGG